MAYELAAVNKTEATLRIFGSALADRRSSRPAHILTSLCATSNARLPAELGLRRSVTPLRKSNALRAFCTHSREYSFKRSLARSENQTKGPRRPRRPPLELDVETVYSA